jgi:hypothetical protein
MPPRRRSKAEKKRTPVQRPPELDEGAFRRNLQRVVDENFGGSRRAFAKAIDAGASRLTAWLPTGEHRETPANLPGAAYLHAICASSGRSADWLLFDRGPEYRGHVLGDDKSAWLRDWPVERRAKLADELQAYAGKVVGEQLDALDLGPYHGHALAGLLNAVKGDFLVFFEATVKKLAAAEGQEVWHWKNAEDAARYRREHAARARKARGKGRG